MKIELSQKDKNEMINAMYSIYNDVIVDPKDEIYTFRKKGLNKKSELYTLNINLYKSIKYAENIICDINRKEIYDFNTLYNFAEFIKVCEKVFLWKNDSTKIAVCDSKLSDGNKNLIFQFEDSIITIDLLRIDEHRDIIIHIKRDFGKKMENNYSIHDGVIKQQNQLTTSDNVLIIATYGAIKHVIVSFFCYILKSIIDKNIYSNMIKWEENDINPFDNTIYRNNEMIKYSKDETIAIERIFIEMKQQNVNELNPNSIIYY